jgi:hypothetical protein
MKKEETIRKMSNIRRKLWQDLEYKAKMKLAQKGKTGKYKRTPQMKTGKHMLGRKLPKE